MSRVEKNEAPAELRKGSEVTLQIEKLAYGGKGIARLDGYVVFVNDVIPGQEIRARVVRRKKGYAEARLLEVLKQAPDQIEPRCLHFQDCGGCRFQHLAYDSLLRYKCEQVAESLQHIAGLSDLNVASTLASPEQFFYRNKMEYSFGSERWLSRREIDEDSIVKPRDFALGLHVAGRFDKILDLDECHLQSEQSMELVHFVREFAIQSGLPAYSQLDHTGFWRHLVIREGKNTGDVLVNLVTAAHDEMEAILDDLGAELKRNFENLTTIVHTINRGRADVALGEESRILQGSGLIEEVIGEKRFQISPTAFFQTNTACTEVLYTKVVELAALKGGEVVYDLYCGTGSISIFVADKASHVVGFELAEEAVFDAERNAALNKVENCSFVAGDLRATLGQTGDLPAPDLIIVDPPRVGLHGEVVENILKLTPGRIVYVSCNPSTFARDARVFCESGYVVEAIQPVDMFPWTSHIELAAAFSNSNRMQN